MTTHRRYSNPTSLADIVIMDTFQLTHAGVNDTLFIWPAEEVRTIVVSSRKGASSAQDDIYR